MTRDAEAVWVGSPHFGYPTGKHGRNGRRPVAIVLHIAEGSCPGMDGWFNNPDSWASTHYAVCRGGDIRQYVDEQDAPYGNGLVDRPDMSIGWLREAVSQGINPNLITVSIEHEGYSAGQRTENQVMASVALVRRIAHRWGIPLDPQHVVGHSAIDGRNRAGCPGPNHPWSRYFIGENVDMPYDQDKVKNWLVEIEWLSQQLLKKDSDGNSLLAPGELESISQQQIDRILLVNGELGL